MHFCRENFPFLEGFLSEKYKCEKQKITTAVAYF